MSLPGTSLVLPPTVSPSVDVIPVSLLQQVAVGIAPGLKRWTADEYHRLIAQGIIPDGAPLELIDGALVYKDRRDARDSTMPYGPRHAAAVYQLSRVDRHLETLGCYLRTQLPILVSESHEPEPDGCIVLGSPLDHRDAQPTASEVCLIIEVADSSLEFDRSTKQRVYATAGIPMYWIVNLRNNTIEVYEQPDVQAGEYRVRRDRQHGETIEVALPSAGSLAVHVDDIIAR